MQLNNNQINDNTDIQDIILEIEGGYNITKNSVSQFYQKYKDKFIGKHFDSEIIGSLKGSFEKKTNTVKNLKLQNSINFLCHTVNKAIDSFDKIEKVKKLNDFEINQILEKKYKENIYEMAKEWVRTRKNNKKSRY